MKKSSLVGHVVELLDLIRPLDRPADNIVKEFFRTRHYLGSKDRRFISDAIYSLLRNFTLSKRYASECLNVLHIDLPEVPSLLVYSAFALKIRNEDVDVVLDDVGGMLRISFPRTDCKDILNVLSHVRLGFDTVGDVERIAIKNSFPEEIVAEWVTVLGNEQAERLCESLNEPAPIVIRVNSVKGSVEECKRSLQEEGVSSTPTLLSPHGLILEKRINTQSHKSFKGGWFEMQDEGSQLVSLLLEAKAGELIVDACAGGGGKTLHLAAIMNNQGQIYAIDVDEKRLASIGSRLNRAEVTITQLHLAGKQDAILAGKADAVLVDAPCSGIGAYRRNPAAKLGFSVECVDKIVRTQRSVLESSSKYVKPGGRLVYATCTLLQRENEDVVRDFLSSHKDYSLMSAPEILKGQNISVDESSKFLTLFPHKTGTDGFFAAVMQRA